MPHHLREHIEIEGAREHNLRDVSLQIPKRQLVVFTGVSGSGKSSLVFDTIAAEAQRELNETFSAFVRNRLPKFGRPDVDRIANLGAVVIIDQKRIGGNARSTVGTVTDIYALIRLLFSRAGLPFIGESNRFSFNDPAGMCPRCMGLGRVVEADVNRFLDLDRSLEEGAILLPGFGSGQYWYRQYADIGSFDPTTPLREWTADEREALIHGGEAASRLGRKPPRAYEGLLERFQRIFIHGGGDASARKQAVIDRFTTSVVCPECHGERLNAEARAVRIGTHSIADYARMELGTLLPVVSGVSHAAAGPVVAEIVQRLEALVSIGLGYLSLDRDTTSLSGGEGQRIKMVRHLGSSLVDMLYVFDEPTAGLHPRDVERLIGLLYKLRDSGNSVLVVEHDRDVIEAADWIVDMGPGAGDAGGRVVFEGPVSGLLNAETLTGRFLRHSTPYKRTPRAPTGHFSLRNIALNNLKHVSVDIPVGVLTVVTGVAGSGKSSLIDRAFREAHPDAVAIDQGALRGSRRSSTATYTGIMDPIRTLFARANGVPASLFSFNSEGACPACNGLGVVHVDLAFMDGIEAHCDVCDGRRFTDAVLRYTLRGRSIADVLEMSAVEAQEFFSDHEGIRRSLHSVMEVGLGYLTLGQPLSTLSGGERQRIKLAAELEQQRAIYIIDEPTSGLHMADVSRIAALLDRLVDAGNSVIVIEHHLDIIANADWVIDLGPEAGAAGGEVLFSGTVEDLLQCERSHTARHLRAAHAAHRASPAAHAESTSSP